MTYIEFKKDYGYPAASPQWAIFNKKIGLRWFPNREEAEEVAGIQAGELPGETFKVLAVMATITTSVSVIGQRFDPTRSAIGAGDALPEPPPAPDSINVESPL